MFLSVLTAVIEMKMKRRHSDEAIYNFETESGDEYHYVTCFRVRFKDMDGIWRMYIWPSSHSISGKIVKADFVKVR